MTTQGNKLIPEAVVEDVDAPNEVLAKRVVADLIENGLIMRTDGERMQNTLAAGKLDGPGWKLAFENCIERTEVVR